jgi:hypothetical protein
LDALSVAFQEDFYASITPIANVTRQAIFHCCAVDEGAETDALNNPCNIYFNAQLSFNLQKEKKIFSYTFRSAYGLSRFSFSWSTRLRTLPAELMGNSFRNSISRIAL